MKSKKQNKWTSITKQKERNPKSTECLLKLENEGKCLEISEKLAKFHFQPKEKNGGSRGKKIQL